MRLRLLLLTLLFSTCFAFGQNPTANFSSNALDTSGVLRVCQGDVISFTNTSTTSGPVTYAWDFGGAGVPNVVSQENPVVSMNFLGTWNASFTVTDFFGTDDTTFTIVVSNTPPTVGFNPDTVCTSDPVFRLNLGTPSGGTYAGTGVVNDRFFDPSIGVGTYTLDYYYTGPNGCRDSSQGTITVVDGPAASLFEINNFNNCNGFTLANPNFTVTVFDGSAGVITNYQIIWGDGSPDYNSATAPSNLNHTYSGQGIYTLSYIVMAGGCTDTVRYDILNTSNPASLNVINPGNTNGCAPFTVVFPLTTTNTDTTIIYTVEFGDGTDTTFPHPPPATLTHVYDSTSCLEPLGVWTITATATNACLTTTSTVNGPFVTEPAVASFIPDVDSIGCVNQVTVFENNSIPGFTNACNRFMTYVWDYGDGSPRDTQQVFSIFPPNQTHVYTATGNYNVTLWAVPAGNTFCDLDSITIPICIDDAPIASFNVDAVEGCSPLTVNTTNLTASPQNCLDYDVLWSINPATGWTVINGDSLTGWSPSFEFTVPGTYTLQLQATNDCGTDVIDTVITVQDIPEITFPQDSLTYCDTTIIDFQTDPDHMPSFLDRFSPITQYQWTITPNTITYLSGTSDISQYPVIRFEPNFYTVILEITNGCGTDADTHYIDVNAIPLADFLAFPICQNDTVFFYDSTFVDPLNGAPIQSWQWDFGDGNSSNQQNPFNLYSTPGIYTVQLVVIDNNGCSDTAVQNIFIKDAPEASFTFDTVCQGNPTTFTDLSTFDATFGSPILSYNWDFGDGSGTSNQANPGYTYTAAGIYPVNLAVTDTSGCVDDTTINVWVHANPVAFFSPPPSCVGDSITFYDSTTVDLTFGSPLQSWLWNFGNGDTSDLQNPVYRYSVPGTYVVSLSVTDTFGCGSSYTDTITILSKPGVGFSMSADSICSPGSVSFLDTSDAGLSLQWLINGVPASTLPNPVFNFVNNSSTTDSLIIISLIGTAASGCQDTVVDTVTVLPKPLADFSLGGTSSCSPDTLIPINNTSAKLPANYLWTVSSPAVSIVNPTDFAPQIIFPANSSGFDSTYIFTLIVISADGCEDTISYNYTSYTLPTASFTIDTSGCGPFSAQVGDSSVAADTYSWSVSPAGPLIDNNTLAEPTFTFPLNSTTNPIIYQVQLVTGTNNGCFDTATVDVTVFPGPISAFTVDNSDGCSPVSVNFTNTSDPNDGSAISTLQFFWDFNNGVTSQAQDTSVAFTNIGVVDSQYVVSLAVQNTDGCTDTLRDTITVYPDPRAEITFSDTLDCAPFEIDTSIVRAMIYPQANDTYEWQILNVSGGIVATFNGPDAINYAIPLPEDSVFVRLITSNVHGCPNDTITQLFYSIDDPVAAFGYNADAGCSPFNLELYDSSTAGVSHQWFVNDSLYSTVANPNFTLFNTSNTQDSLINIRLVVTAGTGCTDTLTDTVTVYPTPRADFEFADAFICSPDSIGIIDQSLGKPGLTYNWTVDDPSVVVVNGNTSSPGFVFPDNQTGSDSTYLVQLALTSTDGCSDTTFRFIRMLSRPVADFSIDSISCGNDSLRPQNNSLYESTYLWSVSPSAGVVIDDNSSANPAIFFPVNTTADSIIYTVSLQVWTDSLCTDTTSRIVTVYPEPLADFTRSDTAVCDSFSVSFTNTSDPFNGEGIGTMQFQWDFGNGITSMARDTSIIYRNTGVRDTVYNISLIAISEHGCSDTTTSTVRVFPEPIAQFTATNTVDCAPFVLDTSVIQTIEYPFANDTYEWYADGVLIGTGAAFPGFTIQNDGDTITVLLVTSNVHACAPDSLSIDFISIEDPVAAFGINAAASCSPHQLELYDSSTAGVSHQWFFNDSLVSTLASPVFNIVNQTTDQDSVIIVTLVVTAGGTGCTDTITDTVTIYPTPIADFVIADSSLCAPDSISITNLSLGKPGLIYDWQVSSPAVTITGQGTANPGFVFPDIQSGFDSSYTIQLIVTSTDGCTDTTSHDILLLNRPLASFTIDSALCGPDTLFPQNLSQFGNRYSWTINPPLFITDSSSANPGIFFPLNTTTDSIVYTLDLQLWNDSNCTDVISRSITVYPKPLADFTQGDTAVCDSNFISFTNISDPFNGEGINTMQFQWDFGNGITANAQNTSLIFRNTGDRDTIYTVTLIAISEHGCSDTVTSTVRVFPNPRSEFITGPTIDCAPFVLDTSIIQTVEYPLANDSYEWYADGILLGNGPVFPGYTIQNDGDTVTIMLITANVHGCPADTQAVDFISIVDPVAAFGVSTDRGCAPLTVNFSDSSSAGTIHDWDFGNGLTSNLLNPTVTFTNNGTFDSTYTVTLITTIPGAGCTDTIQQDITVYGAPRAGFFTNLPCFGDSIFFTDTSFFRTHPIMDWFWDFGDGNTSSQRNPAHLYSLGAYVVSLTVTDTNGCSHTYSDSITYRPTPVADIGINYFCQPDSACVNDTVFLSDNSTIAPLGGNITIWEWDVDGDGTDDYFTQNPSHIYPATGTYIIRLVVESQYGCRDTTYDTIQISEPPLANFSIARDRGCGPFTTTASDSSTGLIRNYLWELYGLDGNGNPDIIYSSTNVDPNPLPNLIAAGNRDTTYYISLTVSNCCGSSTLTDTITVVPIPIPYFAISQDSGCSPFTAVFQTDGLATGRPDSILFDFGDGSPIEVLQPIISVQPNGDTLRIWNQRSHTFSYNGQAQDTVYFVTLRAINECGDSTFTLPMRVFPNNIQGFFNTSTNSGCVPLTVSFNDLSFGANDVNWCFDYDTLTNTCNGAVSAGSNPTHTYTQAGQYVVAMFASNDCSLDTVYQVITVDPSPNADFISSNFLCVGDTFTFTNTSSIATGTIVGYRWGFGDGNTSNATNPTHIFNNEGTYNITLAIESSNGCLDSITRSIVVYPNPEADFGFSNACLNEQPVQFSDSTSISSGNIISRVWDFGDGNTSAQINPAHTYVQPGTYTVTLTVLSDNFCEDIFTDDITIYDIPEANFTFSRQGGDSCGSPRTVQFQNQSIGAVGFEWDFDLSFPGNQTSTLNNPSFTFNESGEHRVRLVTQNSFGCTDTLERVITVFPLPEIDMMLSAESGCSPLEVEFLDQSVINDTISGSQIISRTWYFGDGTQATRPDPTRTFTTGTYSVALVVETNYGCRDSVFYPNLITVVDGPSGGFTHNLITEGEVAFLSNVTGGFQPYTYQWDFGDGNTSALPNPTHQFVLTSAGLDLGYTVCLTVTDDNDCSFIKCDTVIVGSNSVFVPNAMVFAPGLEGSTASKFLPAGLKLAQYHLYIYDRWGNLLWESTQLNPETGQPSEAWDGTYNSEPLPQGVYYWRIDATFKDGRIWKGKQYYDEGRQTNVGTITLIR